MWQAYVVHEDSLIGLADIHTGKLRHSRKEARIEARRLAQHYLNIWVHPSWGIKVPEIPAVNVIVPIRRVEGMYGFKEGRPLAHVGVRWQPEE